MASLAPGEQQFMEIFGATMPALRELVVKRTAEQTEQGGPNKRPHLAEAKGFKGKGWGKGKGSRYGQGWANRHTSPSPATAPSAISLEDLQHMMHLVARLLVQQDTELQMLKMDKQFLLHFETGPQGMVHMFWEAAQVWKKGKEAQPPTVDKSLRVTLILCMMMELEGRLDKMLVHEDTKNNLIKHGWLQTVLGQPAWPYMLWTGEKLEKDETKAAIPHTDMMEIIREIKKNLLDKAEDLVHKFHSVRPLAEQMEGDTLPFLLSISTRGALADRTFELFRKLEGNTVLRIVGARLRGERLKRQPLVHQLVEAMAQLQLSQ